MDIAQIASQLSQAHPFLSSIAANSMATGIVHVCHKLVARLCPGRAADDEQEALSEALAAAVATVLHMHPELGDIDFRSVLDDDRVVAELLTVFQADLKPNAGVFSVVASEKGFDLSSLSPPLRADEVFSQLVESFQAKAMRDPRLRLARIDSRTERMEPTVRETHGITVELREQMGVVQRLLTNGGAELAYMRSDLHAEYRANIEEARDQLKASRFADAGKALDAALARGTFRHTDMRTQAEVHRLHGLACMRLGDLHAAEQSFAAASRCDPSNQKLLLNLAELDLRAGRTEKATDSARLLLNEPTVSCEARRILALAALDRSDVESALQHLDACQDKTTPAWLSIRAVCELERRDFDAALGFVNRALPAEPDDPVLLLQKASILMRRLFASPGLQSGLAVIGIGAQRRQLEELRDALQAAVRAWDEHGLKAYSVDARVQLTTALALLEQKDDALRTAIEATHCQNAGPGAWLTRARCEMESGNRLAAAESLGKAREVTPNDAAVITLAALNKAEDGCPLEAMEDIEAGFSDDWDEREQLEARAMQARFLWLAGQPERVLEFLADLSVELRQTPRIVAARCEYLLRVGRAREAQALLEDAVGIYPAEPVILHLAGEACLATGDHVSALRRYARALRLAPNPESLSGIALACLHLGRPGAALKLLDLYIGKGVRETVLLELRARALFGMGRLQEAAEGYERYLRDRPDDAVALNNAAVCWWRVGRRDKIPTLLERIADADPSNWTACAQLAQLHLTDDRKDEAYRWAQEVRTRAPDDPDALLMFFIVALYTGHEDDAFPVLREITDRFPQYPRLLTMPEAEGIESYRQSLEQAQRVEQWYHNRKLPITLVADALNRALPLYRVVRRRVGLPFWADSGTPEDAERATRICGEASDVVIDYAALVTLAQISRFTIAASCFRTVHVPSAVREQIQADRLSLNERLNYLQQRGHKRVHERLERTGILQRWQQCGIQPDEWPARSSEHDRYLCERTRATLVTNAGLLRARTDEEMPPATITTATLIESLWIAGTLTSEQRDAALAHLRKSNDLDASETATLQGVPKALVIDFFALLTLEKVGVLGLVLDSVSVVFVSPWTVYCLLKETSEEDAHREALSLVDSIETALAAEDGRFLVSEGGRELAANDPVWSPAVALAKERGLPLWSDDLVTRMLHAGETDEGMHFSTRTVVELGRERDTICHDDYHKTVLEMVGIGFEYCSFKAETLVWSIARRNYQRNPETELLLQKRGRVIGFWNVAALAIAELARSHEERGEPNSQQLTTWMHELSAKTGEATAGISRGYLGLVRERLRDRSWIVRQLWEGLVGIWESLGWYVRDWPGGNR